MKKNFLYVSLFAAAFLVSCKSNEVEETPVEEVVTEEVVEEVAKDTVVVVDTVKVVVEEKKTTKTTKTTKPVVMKGTETNDAKIVNSAASKVKQMSNEKELKNSAEEIKVESKNVNSKIRKAQEEKKMD